MIVIDTTVLVYAVGSEHGLRTPCRALVAALRDGLLQATTTVEVIQEFAHVRARRRGRADAAVLARSFVSLLRPLLTVGEDDLRAGLSLYVGNAELGAFDAILAAATMRSGAAALVSADAAFGAVDGLQHVAPEGDDLVARLQPG